MPINTRIVKIHSATLDQGQLKLVSDILLKDGDMAYPTETFYGLGALALSEKAIQKIYRLKKRGRGKPLSVVICDFGMAEDIAAALPPLFRALSREFWPGPLTLVVKAKPLFPPSMLGPEGRWR